MKIKLLIFGFFILSGFKNIAQVTQAIDTTQWLCTYKYEFLQDSTSKNSLKQVQMLLQIGKHVSKFCDLNSFIGDSLLNVKQPEEIIFANISKSLSGANSNILAQYYVFKNYPQKEKMLFSAYSDHKFYKVEQPMQMRWILSVSKDTIISGYTCQKATTSFAGRFYSAWYTTKIPIGDGPYKFNGLPGLIVKISDSKNQHCFSLLLVKKLNYTRSITISKSEHVSITAEEYVKILRNKIIVLYNKIQDGYINFNNEEAKAKSLLGLKAKNNFIERY
jgi:GLPGLI family protein